ncbi:hypothetical protein BaRGS_00010633 [Batillaria attramentaria]|uniref:Uncharacterized protein n=1 Tax=Batillaria attramentaria TaxID=370345 RepID=A0ABD0LF94_9CAEN
MNTSYHKGKLKKRLEGKTDLGSETREVSGSHEASSGGVTLKHGIVGRPNRIAVHGRSAIGSLVLILTTIMGPKPTLTNSKLNPDYFHDLTDDASSIGALVFLSRGSSLFLKSFQCTRTNA